jgi:acyl-CoA synthetase (NDP forming)
MPEAVRAIKSLVNYAQAVRRGISPIPPPSGQATDISDARLQGLLAAHGIGVPRSAFVQAIDELKGRSRDFGFPLALKIKSPQASHKTEVGGVSVNLTDPAGVRNAAEAMTKRLRAIHPDAVVEGFLLQEVVSGTEIILGIREDPQYGPLMLVGLGGVFVEVLQDVCIRLLPVDEMMAREMLSSLAGRALLDAFRGQPARDVAALAKAMAGLSRLFLDYRPWLADLEINPLMVLGEGAGVRAVDVRAVKRDN